MKILLKTKLIVGIVASIFLLGIITVVFVYLQTKYMAINREKENISAAVTYQVTALERFFKTTQNIVSVLAQSEDITVHVGDGVVHQDAHILEHLHQFETTERFLAIYVLDKDGTTILSTEPRFFGKNYSFRDYFQKALAGEPWVDIALGVTSKEVGYYLSHPVIDPESQAPIGVLVAKLNPNVVHEILEMGIDTNMMIVDQYGVIISSDEEHKLYKSLGILSEEEKQEIAKKKRFAGLEIMPLDYQEVYDRLQTTGTLSTIEVKDELDEKEEIIMFTQVNEFPFFVIAETNMGPLTDTAIGIAFRLVVIIILFTLIVTIIALIFFAKKLLFPLRQLQIGINEFGQENFEHKIVINTGDELEELGGTLNGMAEKLHNSYLLLGKKIEKLKKMNKMMVKRELKMAELKKELRKNK